MNFPNTPYQAIPEPIPPPPIASAGAFCLEIDGKWIPYVLAAIKTLAIDRTWLSDSQRVTDEARNLIAAIMSARLCVIPDLSGTEMEDCMGCCIRMRNGVLQVFACGEWQTVDGWDASQIASTGITPPDNTGQIPAGGCLEFNINLPAGQQIPLPTPISTGDSVLIDTWRGQWSDGSGTGILQPYFCADGAEYLLGICTGLFITSGGDPLPTANHMSVIAEVGGIATFLAPMGAERFIPPGVTDQPLVFQANDDTLGDNLGGVSFHVKVCRPLPQPIGITYAFGNGPSSVASGNTITVVSTNNSGQQRFDFTLTECCKIEVLASTGWVTVGSSSSPYYRDCASVGHNHVGADVAPEVFLANVNGDEAIANGAAVFSVSVRITKL